jgi:hypothetical protein
MNPTTRFHGWLLATLLAAAIGAPLLTHAFAHAADREQQAPSTENLPNLPINPVDPLLPDLPIGPIDPLPTATPVPTVTPVPPIDPVFPGLPDLPLSPDVPAGPALTHSLFLPFMDR